MAAKERTKENCRCFDAADPRPRGCTPLGTPKRKSEASAAKRTQYYCPFLTPPNLPPLLSRVLRGCERGATVERSETGVVSNACPCGASNRMSGPALLAGGARCAPPSAPNPRRDKLLAICRGRACPARSLPPNPFRGQSVGEGFIPPAHLPAAASGQRAGRPTTSLKTPPYTQKRTHNRKGHASFFYASFFIALPSGRLTAVSTAASAKLTARYTGNIPASGKLNRATNRRNTSVSKT